MGFAEDIETILGDTPATRQTMLFSATLPPRIDGMARRHLKDPVRIQMGRSSTEPREAPLVRQTAYVVPPAHKPAPLGPVPAVEAPAASIVSWRTRDVADTLT